jgi:hypothetical protein
MTKKRWSDNRRPDSIDLSKSYPKCHSCILSAGRRFFNRLTPLVSTPTTVNHAPQPVPVAVPKRVDVLLEVRNVALFDDLLALELSPAPSSPVRATKPAAELPSLVDLTVDALTMCRSSEKRHWQTWRHLSHVTRLPVRSLRSIRSGQVGRTFRFLVGDECYLCHRFLAEILSPPISPLHKTDSATRQAMFAFHFAPNSGATIFVATLLIWRS